MDDKLFYDSLEQYTDFFTQGLKKKAKELIKSDMLQFDLLAEHKQRKIVNTFCKDYCDDKKEYYRLISKCNNSIPFELLKRIRIILDKDSQLNIMPSLRWYYELFHDIEYLQKAYKHSNCDDKTIVLYYHSFINQLFWGSHHFPESCSLSKEEYIHIMITCADIMNSHEINQQLQDEYRYYKNLYEVWWLYDESDKQKSFGAFCKQYGIDYDPVMTIYYDI